MVLAALGVSDDAVLCADVLELARRDLSGVCALVELADVLSAGGDLGFLTGLDHGGDHNCRSAENDVAGSGSRHGRAQLFHEGLDLRGEHVHLPVAGDNGFTVLSVHLYFSFS